MWATSMLNWYEKRENRIELPESLKTTKTLETPNNTEKEGKEDETIQY